MSKKVWAIALAALLMLAFAACGGGDDNGSSSSVSGGSNSGGSGNNNSGGSNSQSSGFSGPITITANVSAEADGYYQPPVTLTANYVGSVSESAVSYRWEKNGIAITGETNKSITVAETAEGDYFVTVSYAGTILSPTASTRVMKTTSTAIDGSVAITPASPVVGDTLTAVYTGDTAVANYVWFKGVELTPEATGATANTLNTTGKEAGVYYVLVEAVNRVGIIRSSVTVTDPAGPGPGFSPVAMWANAGFESVDVNVTQTGVTGAVSTDDFHTGTKALRVSGTGSAALSIIFCDKTDAQPAGATMITFWIKGEMKNNHRMYLFTNPENTAVGTGNSAAAGRPGIHFDGSFATSQAMSMVTTSGSAVGAITGGSSPLWSFPNWTKVTVSTGLESFGEKQLKFRMGTSAQPDFYVDDFMYE